MCDFKKKGSNSTSQKHPYGVSQVCPLCGWVDRKNRRGDTFACRFCGERGYSDEFAAKELLRRMEDASIGLWTGKDRVKEILLESFRRRLERWEFPFALDKVSQDILEEVKGVLSTVPGKTPDP